MALTSVPEVYSKSICYHDAGYTSNGLSEYKKFTVTPSPCHNGTGRKLPGEYSYSGDHIRYPIGRMNEFYYRGGSGSRQLISNGMEGCLGAYGLDSTGWDDDPISWQIERTNARNRCLNKLYDKIRQSEVNLSTTIGEGRETLTMMAAIGRSVRNPIEGLSSLIKKNSKRLTPHQKREYEKLMRYYRHRVDGPMVSQKTAQEMRDAAAGTLNTVGSGWLGWAVGIKPLLHDVESLALHLRSSDSLDIRYHQHSRGTARYSDERSFAQQTHGGTTTWNIDDSEYYQVGVTYKITDMHAFENWRLGLTVRPTLAWELTTLSFVVDYFIGIGNFMASYESALMNNGIVFESGYQSISRKKVGSSSWTRAAAPLVDGYANTNMIYHLHGDGWAKGIRSHIHKERFRLRSFPVQAMPTLKLPKVAEQLFTVAALINLFVLSRR